MAITVLERALQDCRTWINKFEESGLKDQQIDERKLAELMPPFVGGPLAVEEGGRSKNSGPKMSRGETTSEPEPETIWGKRTRLLHKIVGIHLKLAELYSDSHVRKTEQAHLNVLSAVQAALTESMRRHVESPHPGEGSWLSNDEIGASLESTLLGPIPSCSPRAGDKRLERHALGRAGT